MALELILTATAKYIFNNLTKYGYDNFLKNKSNLYEQELYEIIQKTIVEYAKSFPIVETENGRLPTSAAGTQGVGSNSKKRERWI